MDEIVTASTSSRDARILIVDDKAVNVRMLVRVLEKEGYTNITTITDSTKALPTFDQLSPDLVLLDLMMCPVSGLEILAAIRSRTPDSVFLPVLVLTADSTMETRREALSAGATDFLVKPLDHLEVLLRIGNLLQTRSLYLQLQDHNASLEEKVRMRTRRLAEQAEMMDQASDAFIVSDTDHSIIYWNKGAERIYGWKASEVLGSNSLKLLYRDLSQEMAIAQELIDCGEWTGECLHLRKDGTQIVVFSRRTLLQSEDNRPLGQFSVNTDMTERKLLEKQLYQTQRLESIGALAGGIAHDLNNMLTPITIGIGMLRGSTKDRTSLAMLDTMEVGAEAGRGLVQQLLTFVRGSGKNHRKLMILPYLKELASLITKTFPKSISTELHIANGIWNVSIDITQFYQVVMNLCINARDAMPDGGELTISASNLLFENKGQLPGSEMKPGPYVILSVRDTGIGIHPEVQPRIFEPFFTTKSAENGTGLGLSTTWGIVRGCGGHINVNSHPGKGSRFDVYIPATTPDLNCTTRCDQMIVAENANGECILIAEDEATIREVLRVMLTSAGYKVLLAENGGEAVSLVARYEDQIHLFICDWVMPVLAGNATIQAIHKLAPNLETIVISGEDLQAMGSIPTCVKQVLKKPIIAVELLQSVRNAIVRRK